MTGAGSTPFADSSAAPLLADSPGVQRRIDVQRARSGLAVQELFGLTDDPSVRKRLLSADTNGDGRISRRDVVRVMQSEAAATSRLRHTFTIGAVLLAFCLAMLAANAALTYSVVRMAHETHLHSSGKLTDTTGSLVVGTAQSAELVDLLFAHHAPVEAATALLSMRQLLVRPEGDVGVAAFQVLSAVLDSGRQLELVVAAPTVSGATPGTAPAPLLAAPAEFIRIVISDQGVHEVRAGVGASTEGPSARRLLTVSSGLGGIQGIVHDVIIGACTAGAASCDNAANLIGCPLKPTCGANGKLYGGPCEAKADGTTVACIGCGPSCPGAATGQLPFDASDGRPAPRNTAASTTGPADTLPQVRRRSFTSSADLDTSQPAQLTGAATKNKPRRAL